MTKTNAKAFTLIELLIVIVIIGILAVALIPRLTGAQASARDAARKANVQQLVTGIEMYKAEKNGILPDAFSGAAAVNVSGDTQLVGPYLQSLPKDPNGKEFKVFSSGSNYIVCAEVERAANANAAECDNAALVAFKNGTAVGTKYLVSGQ